METTFCDLCNFGSLSLQVIVRNLYHSKRTGQPGLQGALKGHTADELDRRLAVAIRERVSEATEEKGK